MSSNSYNLPEPRRIVTWNNIQESKHEGNIEPAVSVASDALQSNDIFGGVMKRAIIATTQFPARNDSTNQVIDAPGSGIVLPGGVHIYFLELAPGYTTPMHRCVSQDYLVVQNGSPVLITPIDSFKVEEGKGTYKETLETVCNPGEVVVQRGSMHAWSNRSDEWIRILCVVLDAEPQPSSSGNPPSTSFLSEAWLQ